MMNHIVQILLAVQGVSLLTPAALAMCSKLSLRWHNRFTVLLTIITPVVAAAALLSRAYVLAVSEVMWLGFFIIVMTWFRRVTREYTARYGKAWF